LSRGSPDVKLLQSRISTAGIDHRHHTTTEQPSIEALISSGLTRISNIPAAFTFFLLFHSPLLRCSTRAAGLPFASSLVSHTPLSLRTFASRTRNKKMPPKKEVKEKKILLGRPGNNLKSGIVRIFAIPPKPQPNVAQVGLANVGKSTLFQAITKCTLGNPAVCTPSSSPAPR
jgi:hypothetical protein